MTNSIYIDDTGTPERSTSKYDPGDWKSWVAVYIPKEQFNEVSKKIIDLQKRYGIITEFHFTDIFSAKGEFKKLLPQTRVDIFTDFIELYNKYRFPVIIQSLTKDDVIRNKMEHLRNVKIDGFDFSILSHMSLWFLLKKITEYFRNPIYSMPISIFIDSGKQKPNTTQKVSVLRGISLDSLITYVNSASDPVMQFVDFIAFCTNRSRWILMNNKQTDMDIFFLKMVEKANFNYLNVPKKIFTIGEYSTSETYDKELRKTYDRNGNRSDEEVEVIKNRENNY